MYASNAISNTNNQRIQCKASIPVETYENRAVIDELSKRSESNGNTMCEHRECKCENHAHSDCQHKQDTSNNNIPVCNNKKSVTNGMFGKFEIDDAIIILLIILLLTDGNNQNDFMLPLLLGVLLLT